MNAQVENRAKEQPHEQTDTRINDQTVHQALTGKKERTKKPSEQIRESRWTSERPSGQLLRLQP